MTRFLISMIGFYLLTANICLAQNYLQQGNDCFDKGDYNCAKKNYKAQKVQGLEFGMDEKIEQCDSCINIVLMIAEELSKENFKIVWNKCEDLLKINPKDPNAKKQIELCDKILQNFEMQIGNETLNADNSNKNELNVPDSQQEKTEVEFTIKQNRSNKKWIKESKKMYDPFFRKKQNNYLAWGILDANYPVYLGTSITGRHGGFVGYGYSVSAGLDFGPQDYNTIGAIHYSFGLNFYPYKNFLLSGGYATLGCEKVSRFNDSDGRWGLDGVRQRKGLFLTAGYNLLGDMSYGYGNSPFFSINAGMSYDTFTGKWIPLVNLKVGFAWSLK